MMNHKKLFGLMAQHLQVKDFLQNAEKLYSYEQYSRYPDFEKSAQFCVEALLKAGFSDVESIPVPCDGVTSYMDHTMPQAWDRTGRCTLEILDQAVPEEFRMLCDSTVLWRKVSSIRSSLRTSKWIGTRFIAFSAR